MPFRIDVKSRNGGVMHTEHSRLLNFGATGVLFPSKRNISVGTTLELKIYGPYSTIFRVFQGGEMADTGEVVFMTRGRVVRMERGSVQNASSRIAVEFFGPCRISKLEAF